MELKEMTDQEIADTINQLRQKREWLASEIRELTTELLNRHPPAQAGIQPFIKSVPYEGF